MGSTTTLNSPPRSSSSGGDADKFEEVEEEEEEAVAIKENNTCEKLLQSIKRALRVKSLRRGIGFCCIVWLVYHQQMNMEQLQQVANLLNITTSLV